jgi:hypothetical protein
VTRDYLQRPPPQPARAATRASPAVPSTALPNHLDLGASYASAVLRGAGRGEGDAPRVHGPKLDATAEPEFDKNPACLSFFNPSVGDVLFERVDDALVGFEAPFSVTAGFKGPCKCGDLEYRQFIRGHITRDPGGPNEADYGHLLSKLPLGRLNESFQEDGDTSDPVVNYGHRANPAVDRPRLQDRYTNAKGVNDQAQGCNYKMTDTPWATMASAPGVVWDIQLDFYGEIRNKERAIQRRYWSPIKGRFTAP